MPLRIMVVMLAVVLAVRAMGDNAADYDAGDCWPYPFMACAGWLAADGEDKRRSDQQACKQCSDAI